MPYVYRISRRSPARAGVIVAAPQTSRAEPTVTVTAPEPDEPSYRDLQAQAKELGISGKQTRDELEAAISEAEPDD